MIEKLAENVINDNMLSYSAYVLTQRALPDLRDGLKPVARRIIYSMLRNGTTKLTKSATVEGKIFELHPHGGAYGAMVNLVQKDRQNIPFLEGKGSWGQYTSNRQGAAAARYTEIKLGKPALEMTKELKNNAVPMVPNYDGTIDVPEALPVTWPVILTNHSSGIGVGFSSQTVSYNLLDIRIAVEKLLNKKTILFTDLIPDFATGGVILDNDKSNEGMKSIFDSGSGSFTMRAKTKIEGNKIIVYELPFGVKREQIISSVIKLSKERKLNEVKDIRDGTSFTGMKIVITLKNNINAEEALEKLFLLTPMEANASANMNILYNGYPVVMGVKEVLEKWISWRQEVIITTLKDVLQKKEKELHLLKGLEKILVNIDEVISLIRFSKDEEVISKLMKTFDLDEKQASYVSELKLRNINEEKINKQITKIKQLESDVDTLSKNINDDDFINQELLDRMDKSIENIEAKSRKTEYKKVAKNRVKIASNVNRKIKEEENHEVSIAITEQGYILKKKYSDPDKDREDLSNMLIGNDKIIDFHKMNNNDSVYAFLSNSKIGRVKIEEIKNIVFIKAYLETEESLLKVFIDDKKDLLLLFDNGRAVKINTTSFVTRKRILEDAYYSEAGLLGIYDYSDSITITFESDERKSDVPVSTINLKKSRVSKGQIVFRVNEGTKAKARVTY